MKDKFTSGLNMSPHDLDSTDKSFTQELLQIYDELRQVAQRQLAKESPDHSLQPTALVHELYLRWMQAEQRPHAVGREHLLASAAEAMKHILIDHARKKRAGKRGKYWRRIPLHDDHLIPSDRFDELLEIDEAIKGLDASEPEAAHLFRLRYYFGLNNREAASALGISFDRAKRLWAFSRAWLVRELKTRAHST